MKKNNLQTLLHKQGMTQQQLAEQTGILPKTINLYCNQQIGMVHSGRNEKICEVLNCTPDDLFQPSSGENPASTSTPLRGLADKQPENQ